MIVELGGKFAYLSVHRVTHQIARRDICLLSEKKNFLLVLPSFIQCCFSICLGLGLSSDKQGMAAAIRPSPHPLVTMYVTSGPNDTHCKR